MTYILAAVGVLLCAAALVGLATPATMSALAGRIAASRALRGTAIAARLVFGAIAIIAANATLYPMVMKILGVLAIMAGTLLAFVHKDTLARWIARLGSGNGVRAVSLSGLGLGAFLIHACQ